MEYDVFICHASEDKKGFVRSLANALRDQHLRVWYDEFSLEVGDSLRASIDRGLANSRFGIVVLSPDFFKKGWTQRELGGLVARQIAEGRKVILPVLHDIEIGEVLNHAPSLADAYALSSSIGLDSVVEGLLKTVRPIPSPLVIARDLLTRLGVDAPPVNDDSWLHVCQRREALRDPMYPFPWTFPVPFPWSNEPNELGLSIGWTALQIDWSVDGEERGICQLTPPDQVHEFLREWPGLLDCCRWAPGTLAMYAPQLTIRGFDEGLSEAFDKLLDPTNSDAYESARYSEAETVDGKPPLCGELGAWRHPTFGNYSDFELAWSFVRAHNNHYSRYSFTTFECLTWLLSKTSSWLPNELHSKLIEGMRKRDNWFEDVMRARSGINPKKDFSSALLKQSRSKFRLTRANRQDLTDLFDEALTKLEVIDDASRLVEAFIGRGFITGFYDWKDELRAMRTRAGA